MPRGIYKHKLHTEEVKKRISEKLIGKKRTDKHRRNISRSRLVRKEKFGYLNSPEARKKMSETRKRLKMTGEKCHLWKGGISFEPYSVDWTETLKKSIRERDKYTCQICGKEPSVYVHHINYDKKNCSLDNLITLCNSCHIKTNFNRKKWIRYFSLKI